MMGLVKQLRGDLVFWAEDYPHEGGREDSATYRGHCTAQLSSLVESDLSALLVELDQAGQTITAALVERAFDALRRFAQATDRVVEGIDRGNEPMPLSCESIAERAGDDGFSLLKRCHDLLTALENETGQADSKTDSPKKIHRFTDPPEDVRKAALFLRRNQDEPGGKLAILRQFTADEAAAQRLSNELKPSRYGSYLLANTRFI